MPVLPEKVYCYDLDDLKKNFKSVDGWTIHENQANVFIVRRTKESKWTVYVSVNSELKFFIFVDYQKIPQSHIFGNLINNDLSKFKFISILNRVKSFKVCEGVSISTKSSLPSSCYKHIAKPTSCLLAGNDTSAPTCIRSNKCMLLVEEGTKCHECIKFTYESRPVSILKNKAPLSKATPAQLISTLKNTREKLTESEKNVKKLVSELDNIGVNVEKQLSTTFEKIVEKDGNKFSKLFFDEQKKRWAGSKGRWHPMLVRYALLLHSRSPSAYRLLNETGVLKLPSERTLQDYSHAVKPACGIQESKMRELAEKVVDFKGHQQYVALIFDEMKISEGLVFKSEEIVGYVDLGDFNLNKIYMGEELASHVLAIY
ncbi:Uncharacterised protein r2_g4364, partial [Pycnogonum litorale]